MCVAPGHQVLGVVLLRVESIGRDDGILQIGDLVQDLRKHRDLVGLGGDVALREDDAGLMVDRRQQTPGLDAGIG